MRKLWLKLLIVLAPALLLAVGRPAYAGATFYVNADCGDDMWTGLDPNCVPMDGPKKTIQAAIVEAINGDDIIVAPGTYRELINFLGKSVKLRSSDGPEATIINGDLDDDGMGDGTVVSCVNNETALTVLDGFMITGGENVSGGGMLNNPGSPTVTNCIFRLNEATGGAFDGGGGMANGSTSSPTVTNCTFELNSAANRGGGMFNNGGSPAVTGCSFSNNSAVVFGGGMFNGDSASPAVTNCTFSDNAAGTWGGGMANINVGSLTVTNCIFTRNTAVDLGGGMINFGSGDPTVANCTFSKNSANGAGGAISASAGTFANCIIWDNGSPGVDEIDGTPTVTYSDVSGGFEGEGNINLNPMFVDFPNQDYHLSAGSPCIDAADNTAVPPDTVDLDGDFDTDEPTPFDLDGNPRFVDDPNTADTGNGLPPIVDMGAYESAGGVAFEDPQEFPAFGEATVEAVGSFDAAGNDTQDLAVVIPGMDPKANGNVQVFLNQGNDKTGDWNGLQVSALIPVGNIPSDITAGFFNDDAFVDLAVSNAGDNQLSILLGDGNGSFTPGTPEGVGQAPSAVASAQFDLNGHVDLVVANALDDNVWVLFGDGLGGFSKGPMLPTGGTLPLDVDPRDIDNDKDVDMVGVNQEMVGGNPLNGSVFVILNNGDGTFAKAVNYPVGVDPRQLAIADVDGDTFNDVLVVNGADATVSVLLNQGDGTFGPAIEVGVGTSPRSIDAIDLNGDGDPDLVIAADNEAMEPVVQVLANITSGIGEVEFQLPLEFSVNADPNFVANADFNADERPDIVSANTDDGKTGGSVTVLLNAPPPLPEPCPWDLDGSGVVGVSDFLELLGAWGPCPPKGGCPADFDGSGAVGVSDFLKLLGNWGPCP